MINTKKIFLFILLLGTLLSAQENLDSQLLNNSSFVVDSIKISGNEKTEDFVILRELSFDVGDTVDAKELFFNRERIFSLAIFTRVEVEKETKNSKNIVVISVEESWYIFPVPFLQIREKTLKRTSFGVSFKYKNFRGRNETIRATISLGYDPFFSLEYENPLIIPSLDVSFAFAGAYGTPVNKSPKLESVNGEEFDFKIISFSTLLGKRINRSNNIFLLLGYSTMNAPSKIKDFMASGTKIDRKFSLGAAYVLDSRNLKQNATKGYFMNLDFTHFGLFNEKINYNAINFEARKYQPLGLGAMIKGRVNARHTFGNYVPYYDYSHLGFDYYTRGNRYLIREGNNRLLGSLEMVIPILSEWNFGVKLPYIPGSLTRARIAVVLSIFADAATTFNNNESITFNSFNSGYGGGITFLFLPYSSFRIEYAFNEYGKGEFLLETGISF